MTFVPCIVKYAKLLTASSTKNVPLPSAVIKKTVEGKDCSRLLLFIPLGSLNPNIQEAVDDALTKALGANALTDVALYAEPISFIVFTQVCLRVRGDAVKIDSAKGEAK